MASAEAETPIKATAEVLADRYPSPVSTPDLVAECEGDTCMVTNETALPTVSKRVKGPAPVQNSEERTDIKFLPISNKLRHDLIGYSKQLPKHFYRVTCEKFATLSCFEIDDLHISEARKLEPGFAFQALANFSCEKDLTLKRYLRHHKQFMKRDPSSYVSLTNSLQQAARKAKWHYDVSRRAGRRITIVEITTAGLVPAEVKSIWKDRRGRMRMRKIPVWIRDTAKPSNGSRITAKQFKDSGADIYLSVLEQRCGGFRVGASDREGQFHEFMAGGFVEEKYVTRAMPFDGFTVHGEEGDEEVRSARDTNYVFDWEARRWCYDPPSRKRKLHVDEEDGDSETRASELSEETSTTKYCCSTCGHTGPMQ